MTYTDCCKLTLHYFQSVCTPLWLLLKQREVVYMVIGNAFSNCKSNSAFSSQEAVNMTKAIIWHKEPLMRF
jgi:hypothetical protein